MKTTKRRSLVMSVLMMVLSLALVASGTYALFSDQVKMTHHLQAGELDITLVRTNLTTKALDPVTGYMKSSNKDDVPEKDFSNPNGENVFGITDKTLIVPLSSYAATMKITNNSDVAFGYWIEIKLNFEGENALTDQELAALKLDEQLKVYINDVAQAVTLDQGLKVGSEGNPIGKLAKAPTFDADNNPSHNLKYFETFVVGVFFEDLDDEINNLAQGQSLHFDLIVHAVQLTEEAPT